MRRICLPPLLLLLVVVLTLATVPMLLSLLAAVLVLVRLRSVLWRGSDGFATIATPCTTQPLPAQLTLPRGARVERTGNDLPLHTRKRENIKREMA